LAITGGSAFALGLGTVIAPILTRVYSPADFALLAVYGAGLMTVGAVASWRYELAISLPDDDESAINLLALSILLVVVTASAMLAILLMSGGVLRGLVPNDGLALLTWLLPTGLLAFGVYQALMYWGVRMQAYSRIARTKVSQGLGLAVTQLMVPVVHPGALGLILGDLVGRSAGSGSLVAITVRPQLALVRSVSRRAIARVAREYWRFPVFLSGGTMLNAASFQIPPIYILAMYGTDAGGWFALTQRVLAVPMTVLGQAVAQVYFGRIAQALRESRSKQIPALFTRATRNLALVATGPTLVLIAVGPDLFATIFGATWRPAGEYAQIMAAMLAAQLVVSPVSQTLTLLGLQHRQVALDVARFTAIIGCFLAAAALDLPITATIAVYAATVLLSYLAVYLVCRASLRAPS
jgi:O-antigen/teichoic acid export membrane protein